MSTCIYVYKRAELKGKRCDLEVSLLSKTKQYCMKHKNVEKKMNKEGPIDKTIKKNVIQYKQEDDVIENENGFLLYKNTEYVIDSYRKKIIIGKILNNKFLRLDNNDIFFCVNNEWKYEKF
jgi:hypothetical protein